MRLPTEYPVTSGKHSRMKFRTYFGVTLQAAEDETPSGSGDR
jgi:hypothetical protein